jgi:hypothetical protein
MPMNSAKDPELCQGKRRKLTAKEETPSVASLTVQRGGPSSSVRGGRHVVIALAVEGVLARYDGGARCALTSIPLGCY